MLFFWVPGGFGARSKSQRFKLCLFSGFYISLFQQLDADNREQQEKNKDAQEKEEGLSCQAEKYSPAKLLRECMADYYNRGLDDRYEIDLQIGQEEESICLFGDKGLNSIRHNSEGCTVWVKLTGEGYEADLFFSGSGPGIPGRVMDALKHPELSKSGNIHVMGLRIVRQIVEAHNGSIEFVEKECGNGYAVKIHL